MKKSLIVAAIALASAPAWAQSNVTLYGIIDVGLRHTTNEGPVTDKSQSRTAMVGGGMSQSRWGIRGTEDLGGGSKVLFNMVRFFRGWFFSLAKLSSPASLFLV